MSRLLSSVYTGRELGLPARNAARFINAGSWDWLSHARYFALRDRVGFDDLVRSLRQVIKVSVYTPGGPDAEFIVEGSCL